MKKLISLVGLMVGLVASAGEYKNMSFLMEDVQSFTMVANTTWTNTYPGSTFVNLAGTSVIATNGVPTGTHQRRYVTQDIPMYDFGVIQNATNYLGDYLDAQVFIQASGVAGSGSAITATFAAIFENGQTYQTTTTLAVTLTAGARNTAIAWLPANFRGARFIRCTQVLNGDADAVGTVEDIRLVGYAR